MDPSHIDSGHLRITGAHRRHRNTHVEIADDVIVVVTQAFGPRGDSLVGISEVTFDGYPAITILVEAEGRRGLVHVSPIHGDDRKSGFIDIPSGTKCKLFCPVSKQPLDWAGDVDGDETTDYFAIYLTPECSDGCMVAISDVWGHYHSRIVDNFELISQWLADVEPVT
jgi:hypothetical protein